MEPRIVTLKAKHLVGFGKTMSIAGDATPELWQSLMPRRHEINNRVGTDYYSMRVYTGADLPLMFAPETRFEKWAAVEVGDRVTVPSGMQSHTLAGGLYAVFLHRGPATDFPKTMRHIFGEWLPQSDYELDDREHFEVLAEDWVATDPEAQEEIWVPIRPITS